MLTFTDNICPYCGKPLIDGIMYSYKDSKNIWLPKSVKKSYSHYLISSLVEKDGGLVIQAANGLTVLQVEAKYCKNCKLFISLYEQ